MTTVSSSNIALPIQFIWRRYHAIHPRVRFHGLVLAWLQVADGVLTAIALSRFGIEAEGNVLLYAVMERVGCINALIIAKLLGIVLVCFICVYVEKVRWIPPALHLIIVFYLFGAILPWVEALS